MFKSFGSRKFLLALGAIIYGVYTKNTELIQWALAGYLAAEGAGDAVERFKAPEVHGIPSSEEEADVDTSKIVTGAGRVTAYDEEL